MLQPTFQLSPDQIAFFHREGYLAIPALTTPQDVARLREIYDRLFSQKTGRERGDQFDLAGTDEEGREAVMPQILNPSLYAPELNETLLLANATAITGQLFGPEAVCNFAHAIYKPPLISPQTPWHQDASYWNPEYDYQSISIWVPLQEATPENGCMQFVPRSHAATHVLPHRSINNDPRIHGLELQPDQMHHTQGSVTCPLPPGGATLHGGYMLHYTGANRSAGPRRAIILSGGLKAIKRSAPRDLFWQRDKKTLREVRAKAAKQAGVEVRTPPRGAGE